MNENAVTLETYEAKGQAYTDRAPQNVTLEFSQWLAYAVFLMPQHKLALEIGTGSGRDARLLESAGVPVDRTDAAASFISYGQQAGHQVRKLNVLTDPFGDGYGMVYASAVFHHFTDADLRVVLGKAAGCLLPGGVLAFTQRRGSHAEWENSKLGAPRFFQHRQPGQLWAACEDAGLWVTRIQQVILTERHLPGAPSAPWLLVTARNGPPAAARSD